MKIPNIRGKLKLFFVVALMLAFFAFSNEKIIFAAAPTINTLSASTITKTSAILNGEVVDKGGLLITSTGFQYGTDNTYGNSVDVSSTYVLDSSFGSAGSGDGQFLGALDVATDSVNNIYVVDQNNNRIQKFNSSGVYQSQFGTSGSGDGQFNTPTTIAIDSLDNIYVGDSGNYRVQKFNSSGVYQSQFGTFGSGDGQFGVSGVSDIAIDSWNNIYTSDLGLDRIQKFNSSGVYQSQFGTTGSGNTELSSPRGLAVDTGDNIYIADTGNTRIQKIDSSLNFVSSNNSYYGDFLVLDSDSNLFLSDSINFEIHHLNASFGEISSISVGDSPSGMGKNSIDDIYTTDTSNNVVNKYTRSSVVTTVTGLTCGTTYHYRAYATNSDDTSYGADETFTTSDCEPPIVVTKPASAITKTSAVFNGLQLGYGASPSTIRGIEYGTTTSYGTTLYASKQSLNYNKDYDPTTYFYNSIEITSRGITRSEDGNVYFVSQGAVSVYDSSGAFVMTFGWGVETGASQFEVCTSSCLHSIVGSGIGQFDNPYGIAVYYTGDIYVADTGNGRIQKFDASGNYVSSFSVGGSADDVILYGTVSGPEIIVLDSTNGVVKKFDKDGVLLSQSIAGGLNNPSDMDIDGDGQNIFITNTGDNSIKVLNRGSMSFGTLNISEPTGWVGLDNPRGIEVGYRGNLYISDEAFVDETIHNNYPAHRIVSAVYENNDNNQLNYTFSSSFPVANFQFFQSDDGDIALRLASDGTEMIYATSVNDRLINTVSPFFAKYKKPLICATTYHYRVFATNTDGTGYGSDETFQTRPCGSSSSGGGGGPPPPVYGCTDIFASNYDSSADTDDGTCQYDVSGCMDPLASNYNSNANIDDGSCTFGTGPILGCMNPLATNYNASATSDDGSCIVPGGGGPIDVLGCTDTFADNFDSSATQDDGTCHYTVSTSYGCIDPSALNFNPNATSSNGTCTYEPPPWLPPPVIEVVGTINEVIREATGWTEEEQSNIYKDVAVTGLIVPSLFMLLAERSAIVSVIIRLWNIIPTLLGFRRKRRPWGTVYDSVTKQPLDPVYVTLRDTAGAEVSTSITDLDGRYGFITEMGEYMIDAKKTDYVFPSVKMKGEVKDELYDNLYFGENIKVTDEAEIINKNIPMDALKFNWNEFEKTKNKKLMKFYSTTELFMARIAKIIFIAGFVASFLLIFLEPTTWNYIILAVYVTILILSLIGVRPRKPGFIIERSTGYPMSFAIITVFSALLGQEVAHTIVGKTGKYHILVPKGKYYMKLQKKTGENSYEEIYTSEVFKSRKGYIDKVIKV